MTLTTTGVENSGALNVTGRIDLDTVSAALESLIDVKKCVLSFDKSLIEQLPDILAEQYNIRADEDAFKSAPLKIITNWFEQKFGRSIALTELPELLINEGLNSPRFHPKLLTESLSQEFENWATETAADNRERVLALHKDLAMGAHNPKKRRYDPERNANQPLKDYLRSVTTPPATLFERAAKLSFWELKIKLWMLMRRISPDARSLSVGPRWITEIRFFRQVVGLKNHIGLDLFSDDSDIVKTGDMHNMPFEANTFNFVFIKNTMDKSYDVRQLLSELIRVVMPKGIVAIDQICGHGAVSPIHRTDVQKAENLLALFKARANVKVLVCDDIDIRKWSGDGSSNNVRLAVQILK